MFVIKTKKSVAGISYPWLYLCGHAYRWWFFTSLRSFNDLFLLRFCLSLYHDSFSWSYSSSKALLCSLFNLAFHSLILFSNSRCLSCSHLFFSVMNNTVIQIVIGKSLSVYFVFLLVCLKALLNFLQYCFCFMFFFWGHETCGILTP